MHKKVLDDNYPNMQYYVITSNFLVVIIKYEHHPA